MGGYSGSWPGRVGSIGSLDIGGSTGRQGWPDLAIALDVGPGLDLEI